MNKKRLESLLYSFGGVAAMFFLVVAVNAIGSAFKQRVDLTAEKLFTLSDGTKNILGKLDGTVDIRFYVTQGENEMPIALKNYARRVEDLLAEYKQISGDKLNVQKLDPKPDSDAEDKAALDGVEGQLSQTGDKIYLGLCVSFLDKKVAVPFLSPEREKLLEYDVSRAISTVMTDEKPTLGILSGLPVAGGPPNPMMMRMGQMQGQEPWVFVNELKRDYTVEQVDTSVEKIDDKIKVLLVIHPKDISEKTQYAIDQFVLRGGKLIAMVDPTSVFDRSNPNPMMANMGGGSSSLNTLFNAWGIKLEPGKVIADMNHPTQLRGANGRPQSNPAFLSLDASTVNTNDVVTSQIDNLLFPFPGALTGTPAAGLTQTVLLKSSKNSSLAEGFMAQMSADSITKDFKRSDTEYAMAIRLTGKFKTAFPNGKPKDPAATGEDKNKPAEEKADDSLKESKSDNAVIVVSDVDWLHDQVCVQVQNFFGQRIVIPFSGNLTLVQNMVDLMAGDSNLIAVRSRATVNRPFTVINEMQAKAQEKYQSKIKEIEDSLAETQRKLNELQQNKEKGQRFILSPEQQKELENFREKEKQAKIELKEVRKNLRQDIDSLENRVKWYNIIGMPALVAISGITLAIVKRKRTAAK
ncbi:MAG: Gldg family protein [Verrucomicrobiota bacterium]